MVFSPHLSKCTTPWAGIDYLWRKKTEREAKHLADGTVSTKVLSWGVEKKNWKKYKHTIYEISTSWFSSDVHLLKCSQQSCLDWTKAPLVPTWEPLGAELTFQLNMCPYLAHCWLSHQELLSLKTLDWQLDVTHIMWGLIKPACSLLAQVPPTTHKHVSDWYVSTQSYQLQNLRLAKKIF